MTHSSHSIVIVGGGFIGPLMAMTLGARYGRIYLIDPTPTTYQVSAPTDGRAIALTQPSKQLLERLGVWPDIAPRAQPLLSVVTQDESGATLRLSAREDNFGEPFGHMVDSKVIRLAILKQLHKQSHVTFLTNQVVQLEYQDPFQSSLVVHLITGEALPASLVIGADGARSRLRLSANLRTHQWPYNQTAFVRLYQHTSSHYGCAHEKFLETGPFAILPLPNRCSSIVWTANAEKAEELRSLSAVDFDKAAFKHMEGYVGLTPYSSVSAFSLNALWVPFFTTHRLALIGDAAHQIHPLAGQGLNLGMHDVAALAETLAEGADLGLDIGSQTLLKRYEQRQRAQHLAFLGVTHGLNRLFSNDDETLQWLRTKGLEFVEKTPNLKQFFVQHGTGVKHPVAQ
ncbi:MAG: hypothetical protein A2621_02095 [Alphaproteobacteria bacterium RIFCSPHIGHO2_01_FULL_41_14]|nr:MAG: hypothetical protein A3K20_00205 [Alphaproteobacteria bacterium GWA1_45_9]OFW89677.1 MAG: hypothetical protein A2621_02095 [Alphaproteobacteria bacterium RIFCSPHIGHO2_01_FULL_41_14]HCI49119.1 hypothetical protein [Holosporales bacterium]